MGRTKETEREELEAVQYSCKVWIELRRGIKKGCSEFGPVSMGCSADLGHYEVLGGPGAASF